MSALEVLVEVIDEIHDAERSLKPGDIPDRIIFKHVRTLWHLLLGIEETKFDSHNYELFDLVFENNGEVFTGFNYFGPNFNSAPKNLVNAIGSPIESTKIVKLLDDETGEDPDETSVSFKLSILNKIRYIIFRHHMVVKEVMNESEIINIIAKYMRNDILNTSNELSISLQSNNTIFDVCYRECLETLLLDDINLSIDEMAKDVIESFKIEAGIAYFFNLKVISRYHDQMVGLLKRIFRKHEFVDQEINEFYIHNPIFPLLKPVYRKVALHNMNNPEDSGENVESVTNNTPKLNNNLMIEILNEVSQRELEEELSDVPVTLKLFSQIVQYYCDSLNQDGIKDIENDLYIKLIKSVILQWVDGKIDQKTFINQLKDLSLIPTAMPYQYQNTTFPTVHMRMALYVVKENIRLIETYFGLWDKKTFINMEISSQYNKWNNKIGKKYLKKWKKRIDNIQMLDVANTHIIDINNVTIYYYKWQSKYKSARNNLKKADIIQEKLYYDKWESQTLTFQAQIKKANDLSSHKLRMKFFTLWISAKISRFPETLEKFNKLKKKMYFEFWKNNMINITHDYKKADDFKSQNLIKMGYGKWNNKSTKPLLRLKKMDEDANNFILRQQFYKWKLQIKFISFEAQLKNTFNKELIKRTFTKWYSFKQLTDVENKINFKTCIELTTKYFNAWKSSYAMLCKADMFYSGSMTRRLLDIWKLKFLEKSVQNKYQINEIDRVFKVWKLKTTAKEHTNQKKYDTLQSAFIDWFEKATTTAERLEDCEAGAMEIKQAIYFGFWKNHCLIIRGLEYKADKFKTNKSLEHELLSKKWSWKRWRTAFRNSRRKRVELKKASKECQKRIVKKHFDKWKNRKNNIDLFVIKAINFGNQIYESHYLNLWVANYDHILVLQDLLYSRLDDLNVHLLNKIISKMQLRMIKANTDVANADRFKERWNKLKTKTFFEIWKFKQSKRTSPTPTARTMVNNISNNSVMSSANPMMIPTLNPYIDLAPKDRGSPEYSRPPYQSHIKSVLTGQISQYEINESFNDPNTEFGIKTPITGSSRVNTSYRTPKMKIGTNKFSYNLTRNSPNRADTTMTPVERVKQRNLQVRLDRYQTIRSPPKTGLSIVKESNEENKNEGVLDESIFNSSHESLILSSTPVKPKNGLI